MATAPALPVLLFLAFTRCRCDSFNGYHNGKGATQFGELLKPPPPPPLTPLQPVPFFGGTGRAQRVNADVGYQYQPPPPPPLPPVLPTSDFKFPAPFYKQYNFNFVPRPQQFSTTPSPSLFQKVSGWLFSSQQTGYDLGLNNAASVKKDCNPCNLVPWIPVIRYNVGAKSAYPNPISTYGPPSPTAYLDTQKFKSQPFNVQQQNLPLPTGIPHAVYGPPSLSHNSNIGIPSSTYGPPVSTYGPPSPTHSVLLPSQSPLSSTLSAHSSSFSIPSSSYGVPSSSVRHPSHTFGVTSSSQGLSSSSYSLSSSSFTTPSPFYNTVPPLSESYGPVTPLYEPESLNNQLKPLNDVDILRSPELDLQLPKVTSPSTFKNSYGEPIEPYISDVPYSISAAGAESTKIKTQVYPNGTDFQVPNVSLALSNPAPFTLNRGRNIHTLQPVALPNLSVSPLPPIFNARPFRPHSQTQFLSNLVSGINSMQQISNNVKIEQSVPVVEFTHSIDYPASVVQSPIIDIDAPKQFNQTKAYRNIPNAYVLNEIRDISSQASEDHVSATKTQDASFESTGVDVGNELYESGLPTDFKNTRGQTNNKNEFADLRGIKDEDVDKYRTESNLQNIDSPLLYLKPSAPHKEYSNFVLAFTTPVNGNDYEIYDESPSTESPKHSTLTNGWDETRNDDSLGLPPPTAAQESVQRPKIVQIIVPYTSNKDHDYNYQQNIEDWIYTTEEKYQGRKIPSNTDNPFSSSPTENYDYQTTTTESPSTITENYGSEQINNAAILNDLYDVKEPPFDIIKLQHTIDDWTEQEYSEQHKAMQNNRGSEKYAKQIPDDYFTTTIPSNYITNTPDYNYDYDHEGSSSIQHSVTDEANNTFNKAHKEYNTIERTKTRYTSAKDEDNREVQKLHIYTAASSFRSTTSTTPAPWEKILTSISPLTKEKVYVVTSKPWREARNVSNDWYKLQSFESKKTKVNTDESATDNLPFKPPRFMNRPSPGFSSNDNDDAMNSGSSYGFSKSWYQSINDLENRAGGNNTTWPEGSSSKHSTNIDEDSTYIMIADHRS